MIGPSFSSELRAAGVPTDGYAWNENGDFSFEPSVTQATKDRIAGVVSAHDPTKPAPVVKNALQLRIDTATADPVLSPSLKEVLVELAKRL